MAVGSNAYNLMVSAVVDTKNLQAQLDANAGKHAIKLAFEFDKTNAKRLEQELERIKKLGASIGKVDVFKNKDGNMDKAIVSYTDKLGNATRETIKFDTQLKNTIKLTDNLGKELLKSAMDADKFIQSMNKYKSSEQLSRAGDVAGQIKKAVKDEDIHSVRKLNTELSVLKNNLEKGRDGFTQFTDGMKESIRQTVQYALSIGLVYGALSQLSQGVEYISQLNKEMTNIQLLQVDGAKTDEQIGSLAMRYNSLAKEVGATTLEVSKGSVEWLRQGKTIEQTQQLLRASLMASKLGALDSAQATEYLTAILNGYQMEAEEATGVVDRLISVDNIAATSFSELATAMQYSAAVANETGVSFNNLVGYIATVSSTTRLAPEMIGQAFKTIMTRFTNVKAGATTEDGMTLNNVEKVLNGVGIALRDSADSFRPLEDVISDVAMKWEDLNEVQRAQLSTAIAGTRQTTIFNALMQNYGDTLKYVETQENAAGLASERYAIYLEGVEAAQNRLTASWEGMWQATIESGAITWFLNLGSSMLDAVAAGGGLVPLLTMVLGALVAIKSQQVATGWIELSKNFSGIGQTIVSLIAKIKAGEFSLKSLGITAMATGTQVQLAFGLIGLVLMAASFAYMQFQKQSEESQKRVEELSSEISQLYSTINKQQSEKRKIFDFGSEYDELNELSKATELSTEQSKDFIDVQNEIKRLLPEVAGKYDEEGNFILDASVNLKELIKLKQEELQINEALLRQKIGEQFSSQIDLYEKEKENLDNLISKQKHKGRGGTLMYNISDEDISSQKLLVDESINQIKQNFYSLDEQQQKAQLELLRNSGEFGQNLANELEGVNDRVFQHHRTISDDIRKEYTSLLEDVQSINDKMSILSSSIDKSDSGSLLPEDLVKLSEAYPDYLNALNIENGQLKLNSEEMKKYALEQSNLAIETALLNGATDEQISVLETQRDAFQRSISASKDFVNTFDDIMVSTSDSLSGESKEAFDAFANSIGNINSQFEKGQIDASQYFTLLNEQMNQVDFSTMFSGNQQASQSFFSGMVVNASESLSQISSMFDSGKINIAEYTSQLSQVGMLFETIGGIVTSSGDAMGMTSEQIDSISNSTSNLTNSIADMNAMQEVNNLLVQMTSENLQFGSQQYSQYAQMVAEAMASSNQVWVDAAGNALQGTNQIYQYAMAADGNLVQLANQAAGKTNNVVKTVVSNVAKMLRNLASTIKDFKGGISITPKVSGGSVDFGAIIGGQPIQNWFQIPQVELEIAGTGSLSFASIASGLESFAGGLEETAANLNLDLSIYTDPSSISDAVGGLGQIGGAVGGVSDALGNATNNANELSNALKDVKKNAIDALKAQLKGYKDLIDTRKKLLDSMAQERDYQQQVENKNQEIVRIQNELATLQFDNSEEAQARRLQLQEELSALQSELENIQFDHSIDEQKEALDAEYQAFESTVEQAIQQVQGIQATSLEDFANQLSVILGSMSTNTSPTPPNNNQTSFHGGIMEGAVGRNGGFSTKSNEIFAKLLRNEVVLRPEQIDSFMKNTLPQIAGATSNSGNEPISVSMPITVQGNLDKSVIPDLDRMLDKMIDKLNKTMLSKGWNRRSDLFQT